MGARISGGTYFFGKIRTPIVQGIAGVPAFFDTDFFEPRRKSVSGASKTYMIYNSGPENST